MRWSVYLLNAIAVIYWLFYLQRCDDDVRLWACVLIFVFLHQYNTKYCFIRAYKVRFTYFVFSSATFTQKCNAIRLLFINGNCTFAISLTISTKVISIHSKKKKNYSVTKSTTRNWDRSYLISSADIKSNCFVYCLFEIA